MAQIPSTYPNSMVCPSPVTTEIPVYFNAGLLMAYHYDIDRFRHAVVRVLNLWNEESRTGRRFRYAGDLVGAQPMGSIVVTHGDQISDPVYCDCLGGPSLDMTAARATISGAACFPSSQSTICVRMHKCDGSPLLWNEGIAASNQYSYEGMLTHEMGHAGFGMGDRNEDWGIMRGTLSLGPAASDLHLYPIDQRTASSAVHTPETRQATLVDYDWNSASWSSAYNQSAGVFSTFAPAVTPYWTGPVRPYVGVISLPPAPATPTTTNYLPPARILAGQPTGPWTTYTPYPSTASPFPFALPTLGVRVAVSDYGEVMATWVSCTDNSLYAKHNHCGCSYAYSNTPSVANTPSWIIGHVRTTTGNFDQDEGRITYAPCAVAYSPRNDHFVIAYLNANGMNPFTAFTPAYRPYFEVTLAADARNGSGSWPLRYIGDLALTRESSSPSFGVLTAAAAPDYASGRVIDIVTMDLTWNGSRYQTLEPVEAAPEGVAPYQTTRHFGTLMLGSIDSAVMFWPDTVSSGGSLVGTIRGATSWPYYNPFTLEPNVLTPPAPTLSSSVSARANHATQDGHIVIAFSRE
ncbi:MAG: hypothetical protein IPN17_07975 [Deltaproteobacteria bacterium]|nr:hypothetical protein [Deltaproteobacteria bacterium]MBK8692234.1 hypothetical protein [Deltaproteobacteria bacterium]MBP6829987.1 hypothetical protein [Deltaproteobacteria bacterium]